LDGKNEIDNLNSVFLEFRLGHDSGSTLFTLLNRIPFGKFNGLDFLYQTRPVLIGLTRTSVCGQK
jgi:hypothetical protein